MLFGKVSYSNNSLIRSGTESGEGRSARDFDPLRVHAFDRYRLERDMYRLPEKIAKTCRSACALILQSTKALNLNSRNAKTLRYRY